MDKPKRTEGLLGGSLVMQPVYRADEMDAWLRDDVLPVLDELQCQLPELIYVQGEGTREHPVRRRALALIAQLEDTDG